MDDLHARLYEAIDTDPLLVIGIVETALAERDAEVERLRAELGELRFIEVPKLRTAADNLRSMLGTAHAAQAEAEAERDALNAAVAEAMLLYVTHWKTVHQRPAPDCHACGIGMLLSRPRLPALDTPTEGAPDGR